MKIFLKDVLNKFPEFEIRNYDDTAYFTSFNHDSREIKENDLFIPIVGENFDGHDFIMEALDKGASISLCENSKYGRLEGVNKPVILVDSVKEGLQKILNYSISSITAPIVAISGSTGKTTTKQMLVTILKNSMSVLHDDHSNTVWGNAGVLSRYRDEDVIVLECAMDQKGEIAWHVNSVDPDIGVLLNIGHVHAEKLGSIEDIYKEKKDLADYMERTGKPLVLNIDDERLVRIKDSYREDSELITFGMSEGADFRISDISVDEDGTHFVFHYYDNSMDVDLNAFGEGYAYNAMAAIIVANLLGVGIEKCIESVKLFENNSARFEQLKYGNNFIIVNDAYNANPTSMSMSLDTFKKLYIGKDYYTIAILGDMRELGEVSEGKHTELGKKVEDCGFDEVYYVGNMFDSFGVGEHLESADEAAAMLNMKMDSLKEKKVAILLKGSKSIALYQVPDFLKKLGSI